MTLPAASRVLLLDAKYKPLGPKRRPTAADLYQLTLYSLAFGREQYVPARVVYPDTAMRDRAACAATVEACLEFQGISGAKTIADKLGFDLVRQ
jgi:5-methylcytosine-specific restriction endonuclease McrBC regulatory subunit McrC